VSKRLGISQFQNMDIDIPHFTTNEALQRCRAMVASGIQVFNDVGFRVEWSKDYSPRVVFEPDSFVVTQMHVKTGERHVLLAGQVLNAATKNILKTHALRMQQIGVVIITFVCIRVFITTVSILDIVVNLTAFFGAGVPYSSGYRRDNQCESNAMVGYYRRCECALTVVRLFITSASFCFSRKNT
jgi:hypothetical protein